MTDNPETCFHVSPFLNLYYSLEVATGTIIEAYDEEYAERMSEVFPEQILKRFKQLHDAQRFSWKIKSYLSNTISERKLKDLMLLLAERFNILLNDAFSHYKTYWRKSGPNLIRARKVLEENKEECERLLALTSELLRIPWRVRELHIQLVDPFAGEPMGENTLCLGIGSISFIPSTELTAISYFFILHEATHILLWDSVRRLAEKYTTAEHAEYIDEAVMNLISDSILKREEKFKERFSRAMKVAKELGFPPSSRIRKPETCEGELYKARHERRNRYISYYRRLFHDDWEELLARNETFSKVIEDLLKRNTEKIENR